MTNQIKKDYISKLETIINFVKKCNPEKQCDKCLISDECKALAGLLNTLATECRWGDEPAVTNG